MKQIIDDYSPILEDVPFEEIKDKVKSNQKPRRLEPSSESSLSSSHKKSGKQNVH